MQGRLYAIANLAQGLQSLRLAAAGTTLQLLAHTGQFGSGYQPVQVALALGLLVGVAWLWPRLRRLELQRA